MMGYRCVRAGKETMVVPDTPPPHTHTHADKFMNLGRKANGGSKHTHIRPRYDGSGERAEGKGRKPDLARVLAGAGGLWVMVAS